jgi:heat shock protein HtpX
MTSKASRLPDVITDTASGQRINLLAWQAANRRYSLLLLLGVVALFVGLAYLIAQVYAPAYTLPVVGIATAIAVTQSASAYWFSDKLALRATGARPATLEEHRYLVNITEAVAIGAGVPTPKLYVIDSPAPNAFATGRNPQHGTIAVSKGLIELLDRQELEGVIAHEMAHIRNYDILLMTLLAATVGAIVIVTDMFGRSLRFGRTSRGRGRGSGKGGGAALILLLILMVIAPLLATLLRFAVSRRREYLADASAVYITRNPEGLARALEKLRDYKGEPLHVSKGVEHLFFTNPTRRFNASHLFATHPPLDERINRLRRMS